jgi:hypothetical protein
MKKEITHNYSTTLYAIQEISTGDILSVKNRYVYVARSEARDIRRSLERNDIRIVRCDFVNSTKWITAK